MLSGKAAIAGIGATDFSKNSGRSELRLAAEAVLDALDDAGLAPSDVDGLVSFTMDSNLETAVARATGIGDLTFFSQIGYGRRRWPWPPESPKWWSPIEPSTSARNTGSGR